MRSLTLHDPWTGAHQARLSMGIPRQEYWSRLPFPSLEDLPNPGIEPTTPMSPALAVGFFTTEPLALAQTHAHLVGDVIQPSHPLSSLSPPTFNLSQH